MDRSDRRLNDVVARLAEGSATGIEEILSGLHPAKVADLLEGLAADEREALWQMLPPKTKGEILIEVHEDVRRALIHLTDHRDLADAVGELQADECFSYGAVLVKGHELTEK